MERKSLKNLSDETIIGKLKDYYQPTLFGLLYDRYAEKVYQKSIFFVKDKQIAKDLTHDIFLKLFYRLHQFNIKSRFSNWLYAITYNYCIDYLRKGKSHILKEFDEKTGIINDDQDIEDKQLFEIKYECLNILMDKISPEDKMILLMKYQDDMSINEIQNYLNIGESATKMRINRAKTKLLKLYKENYE